MIHLMHMTHVLVLLNLPLLPPQGVLAFGLMSSVLLGLHTSLTVAMAAAVGCFETFMFFLIDDR